jgi:DNA replication and repair protein RecF
MRLSSLEITNFRNLSSLSITPTPGFNVIHGPNGSGKTTILEAIYLLGMARSFRCRLLNKAIQYDASGFVIVGSVYDTHENPIRIGVEKNRNTKIKIKAANEEGASAATLAKLLPVKLISPDSYSLLNLGPRYRRQFLDWGLFHVEPNFFSVWQRFQRILRQRNSALQQGAAIAQINAWNNEFILSAYELAQLRAEYVQQLFDKTALLMKKVFNTECFDFGYYQGWNKERDLLDVLQSSYSSDAAVGYTHFGPQRADLELKINGLPVQDQLSRGEQKMLVYVLQLAQGDLFKDLVGKTCIYLVDDLAAELDSTRRQILLKTLHEQEAQVFITTVEPNQSAFFENVGVAPQMIELNTTKHLKY